MDDLKRMCGFVYSFWFTCKKGSVKANRTKQKKSYLVWTKASELADFPGVNTPLICIETKHDCAKKNDSELFTFGPG